MIGNKARQGKDVFANFLQNKLDNAFILHFADRLKFEVSEKNEMPLIFKRHANGKNYYFLRDKPGIYRSFEATEMPLLDRIFLERNITEYYCMKEKDPLILQVWGTDFRRKLNEDYWVNKIDLAVANLKLSLNDQKGYIIIPDTRFVNEYEYCKNNNGLYIRAVRLNKDNTQYIDLERDPTHKSETSLDNIPADFVSMAMTGDMEGIEANVNSFIKTL